MFCGQIASSLIWVAAQLHGHFGLPGTALELRHVGQGKKWGDKPFVLLISSPWLCFIKVTTELGWLSALKMFLSTVLCCLLSCFITLMNFPCVGRRCKNTYLTSLPVSIQSKLVNV